MNQLPDRHSPAEQTGPGQMNRRWLDPSPRPRPSPRTCLTLALLLTAGCMDPRSADPVERPNVAPTGQPSSEDSLSLDASKIEPMYRELLAIDLSTVAGVATAQNIDIRLARYQVEKSQGRLESAVGAAFPVLVPSAVFEHVEGTVRATEGNLVGVGFNTFQPSIAVQWVLNPGKVIYEIIAAKKRLLASEHQERAVLMETLRTAANQYYELALAQARVAAAHEAVAEAVELLRISRLRRKTGTGVLADELRAEARLAQRQQDLAVAMNAFYGASVSLTVTLHLGDPTITLVPRIDHLPPIDLVRDDLSIDELLAFAVQFRPDLESVRTLAGAADADRGATWWGAWGPQFQVGYQYGGITGHANNVKQGQGIPGNLIVNPLSSTGSFSPNPVANGWIKEGILRGSRRAAGRDDQTFGFSDQQRFSAATQWRWSLSAFGNLKAAGAAQKEALLDAERLLDRVSAQVVRSQQAGRTYRELIALSRRQVTSAEEALRLTEANLQAGTMTTLDVLQAQDAVAQARLRYAEAVVGYNQSQVNLLAAIGLLDATSIQPSSHPDAAADSATVDAEPIAS